LFSLLLFILIFLLFNYMNSSNLLHKYNKYKSKYLNIKKGGKYQLDEVNTLQSINSVQSLAHKYAIDLLNYLLEINQSVKINTFNSKFYSSNLKKSESLLYNLLLNLNQHYFNLFGNLPINRPLHPLSIENLQQIKSELESNINYPNVDLLKSKLLSELIIVIKDLILIKNFNNDNIQHYLSNMDNCKIITIESLTGGLIFSTLVNIPFGGVFKYGSFTTYYTDAKQLLVGVGLNNVYNKQCVIEMAVGGLINSNATIAISVSGHSMPFKNEESKLGEVYFAVAVYVKKSNLDNIDNIYNNYDIFVKTDYKNFCLNDILNNKTSTCQLWVKTPLDDFNLKLYLFLNEELFNKFKSDDEYKYVFYSIYKKFVKTDSESTKLENDNYYDSILNNLSLSNKSDLNIIINNLDKLITFINNNDNKNFYNIKNISIDNYFKNISKKTNIPEYMYSGYNYLQITSLISLYIRYNTVCYALQLCKNILEEKRNELIIPEYTNINKLNINNMSNINNITNISNNIQYPMNKNIKLSNNINIICSDLKSPSSINNLFKHSSNLSLTGDPSI